MKFIQLLFILLSLSNCRREYSPISNVERIPENYNWTVDTLFIPDHAYVHIHTIWGSTADNVYAAGECMSNVAPSLTALFHYDGKKWQRLKIHANDGGNVHAARYLDIAGVSESDIYISCGGGGILHFDGLEWKERWMASREDLYSIWVNSANDIWTGGYNGTLYHFDGSAWTFYQAPDSVHIRNIAGFDTDEVYALAYNFIAGYTWWYLLKWNGHTWAIQNRQREISLENHVFGIYGLYAVDSTLFSVGEGLWRRARNDTTWKADFYSLTDYLCVFGTSSDNLWLGGAGGSFAYYPDFENALWINSFRHLTTHFRDIWTDGNEVFAVGTTWLNKKSYVIHGK